MILPDSKNKAVHVFLLALAGGFPGPIEEGLLGCCGWFLILPLVVLLMLVAWLADAPLAGWLALVVAGIAFATASFMVASYQPSDDREIAEAQAYGQLLVERFGWLVFTVACSLIALGARWIVNRLWPRKRPPKRRRTPGELLASIAEMESRGLISGEEATRLRGKLIS